MDFEDPIDAVARKERERLASVARDGELRDLAAVMATPEGDRVLRRLLDRVGVHRHSFDPINPRIGDYREGERSVGIWLLREAGEANAERAHALLRPTKHTGKTA